MTHVLDANGRIKRSVTSTGPTAWDVTTVEVAGWEELDRDTLVGAQANFDFDDISQDYEDLKLVVRARTDVASSFDSINIALNNDAVDANYYRENVQGQAAVASAGHRSDRIISAALGATSVAGDFAYSAIMIRRYTESEHHHVSGHVVGRRTAILQFNVWYSVQWETADPITRVTLDQGTGPNFIAGSEAILYGLRKRDVVTAVTGEVSITALSSDVYGGNIIKNSPGQIPVDGAEPQWWDDGANATLTDEDTAGEGIPDKHERCFKLVTSANDAYGYQTHTFADEELLDAGVTEVSFSALVYCATGAKASIGIYGTNLGLQESSQATAGSLQFLKVEGITLHAGDTSIQTRLICDTDTSIFLMPMLNVGPKAMPWKARGMRHVPIIAAPMIEAVGVGDVGWTDADGTALTDNLALALELGTVIRETVVSGTTYFVVGHSDDILGAENAVVQQYCQIDNRYNAASGGGPVSCNDSQVVRYMIDEADADTDVTLYVLITGYWMWE